MIVTLRKRAQFFYYCSIFTFLFLCSQEESVNVLNKQYQQVLEEKNVLAERLQAEMELCGEAEEMRQRLTARKQEMEEIIHDMTQRIDEEEGKVIKLAEEKKKLGQHIQV